MNQRISRDPAERVALGIEFLDREGPDGWINKLDLDRLDVASVDDCPLGQLYGSYYRGVDELFGPGQYDSASPYGFNMSEMPAPEITAEWLRQIPLERVRRASRDAAQTGARLELTPELLEQLVEFSAKLHDPSSPMAVLELDIQDVRVVLK